MTRNSFVKTGKPFVKTGKPLVILTGPTAVGKTGLSLKLARRIGGEIISADSMQVYRHMDIGSAKIRPEEMQGIPHHMIDILEPWEEFNVVIFQKRCLECLEKIYHAGHIPILTGGTGFYIQAVLYGIDFTENGENTACRQALEEIAKEEDGALKLHRMLREADPASAEVIHANNVRRVIRALEFYRLTGQKISEHNQAQRARTSAYNSAYFVLDDDREKLYRRIEERVDQMMEQGLVSEVTALRDMGCQPGLVSMQGLGYKEIMAHLAGETSLERAVELIKQNTRHFAKRQLTWFRREKEVIWVEKPDFAYDEDRILDYMIQILSERHLTNAP